MRLRTSPSLRVANAGPDGVRFEDVVEGNQYEVATMTATLLSELRQPEERETLIGDLGIPENLIDELHATRLLVDASDALSVLQEILRPFSPTFASVPAAQIPLDIAFIGVPSDVMSVTGAGAAGGPGAIRLASQFPPYMNEPERGGHAGWFDERSRRIVLRGARMADLGDVRTNPGESPSEVGCRIRGAVHVCHSLGVMPVLLGGDHSITWWAAQGLERERFSILHIDAHSDLADPAARGLPSNASVARSLCDLSAVEAIVTVGVRGFLPVEQTSQRAGHRIVSIHEARRIGIDGVLQHLPEDLPCYVSLDLDALDPTVLPATNAPVPGGFSFDEMSDLLAAVGRARRIIACDVVELNASRDPHLISARVAAHLIRTLLGAARPGTE